MRTALLTILCLFFAPAAILASETYEVWGALVGPIEGATVEVERLDGGDSGDSSRRLTPDAEGRFDIAGLELGMWRISIAAPDRQSMVFDLVPLSGDLGLPPVELSPVTPLRLKITDPEGRPVEGALVHRRTMEPSQSGPWPIPTWRPADLHATSGSDGIVVLPTDRDSAADLLVVAEGFVPWTLDEPTSEQAIRLQRGVERILDFRFSSGQAMPGVVVRLGQAGWPVASSDDRGLAKISVPERGSLQLSYDGGDSQRPGEMLRGGSGSATEMILMPPPATVRGSLVDGVSGAAVAEAVVWPVGGPARAGFSDPSGSYEVTGLHPSESWLLVAADGYESKLFQASPAWGKPGSAPTVALDPAAEIVSRVQSGGGRPLSGVTVHVSPVERTRQTPMTPPEIRQTTTDSQGRFVASGLPARTRFKITATKPGWAPDELKTAPLAAGTTLLEPGPVLRRGVHVVGEVVDLEERPVQGARVELTPEPVADPGSAKLEASTSSEGSYSIPFVRPGTYRLRVEHPRFASAEIPGLRIEGEEDEQVVEIIRLERGAELVGRVVDSAGRPLAGADVKVFEPPGGQAPPDSVSADGPRPEAQASSDSEGMFRVERLPTGLDWLVEVALVGYSTRRLHGVAAPSAEILEVELEASAHLAGRVSGRDGGGLYRAALTLFASGSGTGVPLADTLSEENGDFEFPSVPAGEMTIVASAVGYQQTIRRIEDLAAGESREGLEIVMESGGLVTGVVLDPNGGPVAGARVGLLREAPTGQGFFATYYATESDGDGLFELRGLPLGEQIFGADHPSYPREIQRLEVRRDGSEATFRFEAGTTVYGHVVDAAGLPLSGARVVLISEVGALVEETGTESRGRFQFEGVSRGTYRLVAEKEGYARGATESSVDVAGQPSLGDFELRLAAGTTLEGLVVGVEAAAMSRVSVVARHAELGQSRGVVAADGSFRIENVAVGEWLVEARAGGSGRSAQRLVEVREGEAPFVELDLAGGLQLTGTVYLDQEPRSAASVSVTGLDVVAGGSARTDAEGGYRLDALKEGTYRLVVVDTATGLRHSQQVELLRDETVDVHLLRGMVSGTVVDAETLESLSGVQVVLMDASASSGGRRVVETEADGRFEIQPVSEGSWQLQFQMEGYETASRPMELTQGRPAIVLDVELRPTAGAELLVRRWDGATPGAVRVAWLSKDGRLVSSGRYPVESRGRVVLPVDPIESPYVLVAAAGAATAWRELSPGRGPTEVLLDQEASLIVEIPGLQLEEVAWVTLVDSTGGPLMVLDQSLQIIERWPVVSGQAKIEGLEAGVYTVEVGGAGRDPLRGVVNLAAGQTVELRLE